MANKHDDEDTKLKFLTEEASSLNLGADPYFGQQQAENSANQKNGHQESLRENDDQISDAGSHLTHSSISLASSAAVRGATKIYYHIDDEQTPYCTEVPIPPDRITLAHFKQMLSRTNFKFYSKAIDPEVGGEVKAEIRDDLQPLTRSSNGQFELFLLTAEGSSLSDGTSSAGLSKVGKRLISGTAPFYPMSSNNHLYRPRCQFETQLGAEKTICEGQQYSYRSDKICRDLKHVQTSNLLDFASKHEKLQRLQNIRIQEVFDDDDGRIAPSFFNLDFHVNEGITKEGKILETKKRVENCVDLYESYGPSTSNWTDETDSSETSSPVFAPKWRRNRMKFFQHQRRYYRTQHPRKIYNARHFTTGKPIKASSGNATTSSICTTDGTPGPLKRFSCLSNLCLRTTTTLSETEYAKLLAAKAGSATIPRVAPPPTYGNLKRRSVDERRSDFVMMKDLHFKVSPFPKQRRISISAEVHSSDVPGIIRPLHRTSSEYPSKLLSKLPPLTEEETVEQQQTSILDAIKTTDDVAGPSSKIPDFASGSTFNQIITDSKFSNIHNFIVGFRRRISHLSLTSNFSSDASFYLLGHRRRPPFEDSTIYTTETDARIYSDDESRLSTSTDNITSVSRQHYNLYRKRRRRQLHRNKRQPSRASSLSSMTETSMTLEVITVTLNMDPINYLGISIVGQSSSRGDNGIYVANVMKGGAVALDGRIEPGDMILQVNDISFENLKNDKAVEVLKEAVNQKGPIKLTVAKSFDVGRTNFLPEREPVRPIDTHAWVQHTNAIRGMTSTLVNAMNAIPECSEGAPTPIPGQHPHSNMNPATFTGIPAMGTQQQRPASNSTTVTSNGSATAAAGGGGATAAQTILGPGGVFLAMQQFLDLHTDKRKVIYAMAMPNSGLDIRDRTWLKIPIPMSFLGSSLVDWLLANITGIKDRKDARRYASELLKERLIAHVVNKQQFTEQCYYVFGEECTELCNQNAGQNGCRHENDGAKHVEMSSQMIYPTKRIQMLPPYIQQQTTSIGSSEYASMPPVSPYSSAMQIEYSQHQQKFVQPPSYPVDGLALNPLQRVIATSGIPEQLGTTSQTSNNSNEESSGSEQRIKARAVLPPAPSLNPVNQPNAVAFQMQKTRQELTSIRQPTGAPPTTPIGVGDEMVPMSANRFGCWPAQSTSDTQIKLAETFPDIFIEHF